MDSLRTFTVACGCGSANHTFTIPSSKLPLPSHLCSCNTSRRISGSLLTSYINITHDPSAPKPNLSSLTAYHSSKRLTRYFCATCGTHMYLEYKNDGHFEAATGTLQVESAEWIVKYESCMWIEDTRDGGASIWLRSVDGKSLERWSQEAGESDRVSSDHFNAARKEIQPAKTAVHAHCQCNGVEFWIAPPDAASKKARSDFSDLIVPYHRGQQATKNPQNLAWWLCDNATRFLAGTCACLACRRASGFDITFWAFIPNANIFLDSDLSRPFPAYGTGHSNEYWGTMRAYCSSEGVTRTFCGTCGANVFWDGGMEKGREGLIDVAVGLMDADSGARAEELLSWWTHRVSFEEFATNRSLVQALGEGLRDSKQRKGRNGIAAIG